MSLCPHGYTAFWDCPLCPEPLGTAPDYLDKDVLPQPAALDWALAALQQRTTERARLLTLVCRPDAYRRECVEYATTHQGQHAPECRWAKGILAALERRCPLCTLPWDRCHCREDEQLAGELPRPWPEPQ